MKKETIILFFQKYYLTIIKVLVGLFLLYWLIFFLTPKVEMAASEKEKIDSLNKKIDIIYVEQKKLDEKIVEYNNEITKIDDNLEKIKNQKTIIKEIYHEEIGRVDNYTDAELDSFFAKRYGR